MSPTEIIYYLYEKEGIRNREFLNAVLTDDFQLEWNGSTGIKVFSKNDILNYADELKNNFHLLRSIVISTVDNGNSIAVYYSQQASVIENPNELLNIGKIMVFWEFENNQIKKGYQISKQI